MDLDAIKKLESIFEIYSPQKSCFRVECTGELSMYPHIIEYLNNKSKIDGYIIEILSNGVFMPELINKNQYLNWVFSLDGNTENMNLFRNLDQNRIEKILDMAIETGAELQTVFLKQTYNELNGFIDYLEKRSYKGFLHIFPCRFKNKPVTLLIDYDKLTKADFLPDEEYFRRWKAVYYKGRNFTCDVFRNGYTYRITPQGITKIKCECFGSTFDEEKFDSDQAQFTIKNCGTCFTHYEYNNKREIVLR